MTIRVIIAVDYYRFTIITTASIASTSTTVVVVVATTTAATTTNTFIVAICSLFHFGGKVYFGFKSYLKTFKFLLFHLVRFRTEFDYGLVK